MRQILYGYTMDVLMKKVINNHPQIVSSLTSSLRQSMKDKVIIVGYVYPTSRQNGFVISIDGISPCLNVGCHSGVEPKLQVIIENG